jgi:hypothetical protein
VCVYELAGDRRSTAVVEVFITGHGSWGKWCHVMREKEGSIAECWFCQGVRRRWTPASRAAVAVENGKSRGGGRERAGWAVLGLGLGLGLGRLGPAERKGEGREPTGPLVLLGRTEKVKERIFLFYFLKT